MSLDDLYMPAIRIDGCRLRVVMPLGPYPEIVKRTPAQLAAGRKGRLAQIGKAKAANRVRR